MKKIFTASFILILALSSSFAQQNMCGSDIILKEQMAKDPAIALQREVFEKEFAQWKAHKPIGYRDGHKYIIPVVFHVIHEGGPENITKAQIDNQLSILNKCFRHENSDSVNTPAPFLALAGKLDIEFRLAQLDPQGNCTEGITRTFSNKTNNASNSNELKELIHWNCYSYLNIWVVKTIDLGQSGVVAFAQFPASGLCSTDGIVIMNTIVGTTGTAANSSGNGRTLVHETGHWLNLIHIWGDALCGSDQVVDTPNHRRANFGVCYDDYPYLPDTVCPGLDSTTGEMMVNYMDYSDGRCQSMFTKGQCERMEFVLTGVNGNNGIRSYLWSDENLALTGTYDGYIAGACAPVAHFSANKPFACTGTSITFTDRSYNGTIQSRLWTFTGGNPATSTLANPNVTYDTPGIYPVTLEVTNAQGTDIETIASYIHISGTTAEQSTNYSYYEDFEDPALFESNWVVVNPDNKTNKWEIAGNLTSPSGGGALRVRNFGNTTTEFEEAISPSYNLSNLQQPVVFSYMYSGATTTYLGAHNDFSPPFTVETDAFKIYYSTNCGQSWTNIPQLALSNDALYNAGLYTESYVPDANSIWGTNDYTLPNNIANSNNIRFKFRYEVGTGYGNNFYLDGIRFENITAIQDLNKMLGIQVFPNPTAGSTRITLNTPESGKLSLMLVDVLGRDVASVYSGSVASGEQVYTVDVNDFDAGIYFLKVNYNDKTSAIKLVVQ